MTVAAICNECSALINEGQSAYYDDYQDLHYCNRSCYNEWARDNADSLAAVYAKLNCERVDL
jgi:hypothetical protein